MPRLEIEPINLHWLYDKEPTDLCAHGGIRVLFDGAVVFVYGAETDGLTLSTAALHLLRTIERDYAPGTDASGQLIPCCGNWMIFDPELNEVCNSPCPNGVEWTVRHAEERVEVCLPDATKIAVEYKEWKRAVFEFSAHVRVFYFADPPRVVTDELDAAWHPHFIEEWARRHAMSAEP